MTQFTERDDHTRPDQPGRAQPPQAPRQPAPLASRREREGLAQRRLLLA